MAQIIGSRSDTYEFDLRQVSDGETIELGQTMLKVMHTPGHTPEHISLQLFDAQQGEQPIALFTGDTLFNLDVGRPDLLGEGSERKLAARCTTPFSINTCHLAIGWRSTPAMAPARPAENLSATGATPHLAANASSTPPCANSVARKHLSIGYWPTCRNHHATTGV